MRVNHDVVTSSVSDFSMDGYTFEMKSVDTNRLNIGLS